MNYTEFKDTIVRQLKEQLSQDTTVKLHTVTKNNAVMLDAITILDASSNIAPTIYLNPYYEDFRRGKTIRAIASEILAAHKNGMNACGIDLSCFTDSRKRNRRLVYRLVSFEKNAALLQEIPHLRFLDLAITFCCLIEDGAQGVGSVTITTKQMELWGLTFDQLVSRAVSQTPQLLPDTVTTLASLLFCNSTEKVTQPSVMDEPLYILTNRSCFYGAACVLYPDVLKQFADTKNCNLYLLPSSVHEILLLPENQAPSLSYLNRMIREINTAHVAGNEILSDHAYYYDRKTDRITIPGSAAYDKSSDIFSLISSMRNPAASHASSDASMRADLSGTD